MLDSCGKRMSISSPPAPFPPEGLRDTMAYLECYVMDFCLSAIDINWWERKESNLVPMRVTAFTAQRPPLVLTPGETVLLHALAPIAIVIYSHRIGSQAWK